MIRALRAALACSRSDQVVSCRSAVTRSNQLIRLKLTLTLALLLISSSVWAKNFRVHYSIHGSGRNIIQAQSSGEARRTVMDMFPDSVVTGVSRIK